MLTGTPLAMVLVDGDRRVRQLNRAGAAFAGCDRGEALGLRLGTALRCLNTLEGAQECGTGPACKRCVVRETVQDTLENRQAHLRVSAALSLLQEGESREVHLLVSSSPVELEGEPMALVCLEDVTDREEAEQERQAHVGFLEALDRVNRAIQGTNDLDQMMSDVLDVVLSTFDCDRAALVYPSDPDSPIWRVPMERTRPEYPGAGFLGVDQPRKPEVADIARALLASSGPVTFGPECDRPLPPEVSRRFRFKSMIGMALYPKVGQPWEFILHQCSHARVWSPGERRLVQAIGQRLSDALTILLSHRELRESERRFRALVERAADAFYLVDRDGRILDVNQSTCDGLGYRREELVGMNIADVDIEVEPKRHKERFWDVIGPGETATFEGLRRRKDGSEFPVEVRMGALELGGEQLMLGLARDISERKQMEEALAHREWQYRTLLENLPDLIIRYDTELRRTYVNPAWEKVSSLSAAEVVNRPQKVVPSFPKHVAEEYSNKLRETMRTGVPQEIEFSWVKARGERLDFDFRMVPDYGSDGAVAGVVSVGHDLTERRRMEEGRQQLADQLYHSQKMEAVGQLAGGVAHDFNNLLTVILGNVDAIEPALTENAMARRALESISEAARQASGVTRSLLTFSSRIPVDKEPVDLQELVRNAAQLLRRMMPSAVSLVTDPPGQPSVWVSADRTQLQQVIINLAINGRDAMLDGGTLRIGVADLSGEAAKAALSDRGVAEPATDRVARLTVSDTGTGISPELKDRVFEPFFTTKPREQGTGLGLAIVHAIVKEHDGFIAVDSAPGKGTTVAITLPVTEARGAEPTEERAPSEDRAQGELVLVAEDNANVRGLIATVLSGAGFQVLEAADGASLMERFAERLDGIRLLIVDVDLPKRSGLDCLREIRGQGATTPAIIVTGGVEVEAAGILDRQTVLLRKPFRMSKLQRVAIDMLSDRHERRRPAQDGSP